MEPFRGRVEVGFLLCAALPSTRPFRFPPRLELPLPRPPRPLPLPPFSSFVNPLVLVSDLPFVLLVGELPMNSLVDGKRALDCAAEMLPVF